MNKKGFTLIELLAILIILGAIATISVTSVINITKKTEDNSNLYDIIYMACENYIYNNYENYKELDEKGSTSLVSVIELINNDYLKNTITNPIDGEKFTSIDYIEVTRNDDMTFSYKIADTFSPLIKLNKKENYINDSSEFVTAIFDKEGGTLSCTGNSLQLTNLTYNSLAIGSNQISCVATANNGTSSSLADSIVLNGYFDNFTALDNAYKSGSNVILPYNGRITTSNYNILLGSYLVEINGSNLALNDEMYALDGENRVAMSTVSGASSQVTYCINLDSDLTTNGISFNYKNLKQVDSIISNIKVTKIDSCVTS